MRNFGILSALLLAFIVTACSDSDNPRTSVNAHGTYLAENIDDFVQLVTLEQGGEGIKSSMIVHYNGTKVKFPIVTATEQLRLTTSGGSTGGNVVVGHTISGGAIHDGDMVSNIDFKVVSADKIEYEFKLFKSQENYLNSSPLKEKKGFLIKTKSDAVLKRFTRYSQSYSEESIMPLAHIDQKLYTRHPEYVVVNNKFCQSYFLNSCESLIKLKIIGTENQPESKGQESQPPAADNRDKSEPRHEKDTREKQDPDNNGSTGQGSGITEKNKIKNERDRILQQPITIDPPSKKQNRRPYPYITVPDNSYVKEIVKRANVTCEDKNECPESAALLIGNSYNSVFQCSTTYIGNGYFVSNSHCLPDELRVGGLSHYKDCKDKIWVKFPKTQKSEAKLFECSEISYATIMNENKDPHESRDIMVFKVSEVPQRQEAAVNWKDSLAYDDIITFWPSDPIKDKGGINGIIRKKTCKIDDTRGIGPLLKALDKNYPVSYLSQCSKDIIPGNSGSMFFAEGLVGHGVISHTFGKESLSGMASNFSCSDYHFNGEDRKLNRREVSRCQWIQNSKLEGYQSAIDSKRKADAAQDKFIATQAIYKAWREFYGSIADDSKLGSAVSPEYNEMISEQEIASKLLKKPKLLMYNNVYKTDSKPLFVLTGSNGDIQSFELTEPSSPGLASNAIFMLPSCLENLSTVAEKFRLDNWLNPISSEEYSPVKFTLKIPVYTYIASLSRLHSSMDNLDTLKIERNTPAKNRVIALELTMSSSSDYFRYPRHENFNSHTIKYFPKIKIEIKSGKVDYDLQRLITRHLKSIKFCSVSKQ